MGGELGAILTTAARAPLGRAASHFCAGRVREGLDAIHADELLAYLQRGAADVAARAGVRASDVEALLPWRDLQPALEALRAHHGQADVIWREQGQKLGGFLAGVAEVTVDAEHMDDAGFYLDRLAGKLARDRSLSGPLDDLAADVTRWEELVSRLGPLVDEGRALERAYLKKRLRRAAVVVIAIALVGAVVAYAVTLRRTRGRIEAGLVTDDPCAVEGIDPSDMTKASAGQFARADELRTACAANRERQAYVDRCNRLADHAEAGSLDADDRALVGGSAPLLDRAHLGTLSTADLLAEPVFPCADVAVDARLWAVYLRAVANAPPAWRHAKAVSEVVRGRLATSRKSLSDASIRAIAEEAEPVAERAVQMGQAADVADARARCDLMTRLSLPHGKWCTALGVALARTAARP